MTFSVNIAFVLFGLLVAKIEANQIYRKTAYTLASTQGLIPNLTVPTLIHCAKLSNSPEFFVEAVVKKDVKELKCFLYSPPINLKMRGASDISIYTTAVNCESKIDSSVETEENGIVRIRNDCIPFYRPTVGLCDSGHYLVDLLGHVLCLGAKSPSSLPSISIDAIMESLSLWHDILRCHAPFTGAGLDGLAAPQCNPHGVLPCCAPSGHCGKTTDHCDCASCVDYRKTPIKIYVPHSLVEIIEYY